MDRESWDAIKKLGPNEPTPILVRDVVVPVRGKPGETRTVRRQPQLVAAVAEDGTKTYTKATRNGRRLTLQHDPYKSPRARRGVDDTPRLSQVFRAIRRLSQASAEGRES
jgi:hypothetical protein